MALFSIGLRGENNRSPMAGSVCEAFDGATERVRRGDSAGSGDELLLGRRIAAGQKDGTISADRPAAELAKLLLSVLLGIRVLARIRPLRTVLEAATGGVLELLKTTP